MSDFLKLFVSILFDLMSFAILIRVLMSWVPGGGGRVRYIIHDITEPVLGVFRKIVPRMGMIDFSPIVAFIALDFVKVMLIAIISSAFI